jgi:hypothetical protein
MPFEPVGGQEFSVVIGGFIDESLRDEWTASPTRLFAIRSPTAFGLPAGGDSGCRPRSPQRMGQSRCPSGCAGDRVMLAFPRARQGHSWLESKDAVAQII